MNGVKKKYDYVFLTNTPSFYKLNLFNEIAKERSVLLVFLGYSSQAVNIDLNKGSNYLFDSYFLYNGDMGRRSKIKSFFLLLRLILNIKYKKILYAGWCTPEYSIVQMFISRRKNILVSESSEYEYKYSFISDLVKRLLINRCSVALVSGVPHVNLLKKLNYKGEIRITGGVGIFNKNGSLKNMKDSAPLKFLYVGRLIDVKNVKFLVERFNELGKDLTIVGCGILESELRLIAKPNIIFHGFVPNEQLANIYNSHDVFILPSLNEPWGLVVEEALFYSLPVIVSNQVGCSMDLVQTNDAGVIFDVGSKNDFICAINEIEINYLRYSNNAQNVDFNLRDINQTRIYCNLI